MADGRVLVIEGDMGTRREIVKGLSAAGFEVYACRDGVSAIHELEHSHSVDNQYNYIVTDSSLPDISGMKILKVLKTDYPHLPMVVVGDSADESKKQQALEYDNTGFVAKPVGIEELVGQLDSLQPGETTAEHTHRGSPQKSGEDNKAFVTGSISGDQPGALESLRAIHGVSRADLVDGEPSLVVTCFRSTAQKLTETFEQIQRVAGIEVDQVSNVAKVRLDKDVSHFIGDYNYALELTQQEDQLPEGPFGYLLIDVDPAAVQEIYTSVYFFDETLECEVTDGGNRIVAYTCETDTDHYATNVERLKGRPGVISVISLTAKG